MKITELFKTKTMLAPMAGYTDVGFRALCRRYGAGLTVTEMVSSKALIYKNHVTHDLLKTTEDEYPKCIQLFGHEKDVFKEALQLPALSKFDIIDINMGCPVPKIFNNGDGCALMGDLKKASEIISAVKKTSGKFTTVKFRKGIDSAHINAVEFAKMCADSGADMITVHGRTREQYYSGNADWDIIEEIAEKVDIPVIANGDIKTKEDYIHFINDTACYGVAIGRGAEGKPWIFAELNDYNIEHDLYDDIMFHFDSMSYLDERIVVNEMKKHLAAYLKGIVGYRAVVNKLCQTKTLIEMKNEIRAFLR